jgi:hypothetical protein
MNGFGTARHRPLPAGFLASGWHDGNLGENDVCRALAAIGVAAAYNGSSPPEACQQQYTVGPYTLDFAWPKLRIALEADGSAHDTIARLRGDRKRDAWLRRQGWLVFRVDVEKPQAVAAQVGRVVAVVRALARA